MGVGYKSLLTHMYYSLRVISYDHFNQLNSFSPKQLKNSFTGFDQTDEVVILDKYWGVKSVDICVGDLLVVQQEIIVEGACVEFVGEYLNRIIYRASKQGLDRAQNSSEDWAAYIRVSRRHYEGLVQYRHFAEIDHE